MDGGWGVRGEEAEMDKDLMKDVEKELRKAKQKAPWKGRQLVIIFISILAFAIAITLLIVRLVI